MTSNTQDNPGAPVVVADPLQRLRGELETHGFTIGPNNLGARDNECSWYAWRRLPDGTPDCECNDKPPSFIVTPHLYTIRDRKHASAEVAITGQHGEWFQLKAYGLSLEELTAALPSVEAKLLRAWSAIAAPASQLSELQADAERMRAALEKFAAWFSAQASRDEAQAMDTRFPSMAAAYKADAKNYRVMEKAARAALKGQP